MRDTSPELARYLCVPLVLVPAFSLLGCVDTDDAPSARTEFEAVAARLDAGTNPYVSRSQVDELRKELANDVVRPRLYAATTASLSRHLLRLGEVDEALELALEAYRLIEHDPTYNHRDFIERGLAEAWLRKAEVENCIVRHNRDCCIFPLEDGGVHRTDKPAREALAVYLGLARRAPDDLALRWMCNLLAMAVDEHPEALPAELVIPSSAFDSEADIGRFVDVAPKLGVDTRSMCGGSSLDDYDGDGLLDIVASNFDPRGPLSFFVNDGRGGFVDRRLAAGLIDQVGGLNLINGDYDNDGDADLFVLRGAWLLDEGHIRNSLLRNDGAGRFEDVTRAAGVAEPAQPTQTGAFGDFDNDGWLDLFVGNESVRLPDGSHQGLPSNLFRNRGDGTFALTGEATNDRYCKGVAAGDFDNDGDLDLYVSNIGRNRDQGVNRLYENDGKGGFRDVAEAKNVQLPTVSFATWFFDFDNDGWLDLFVGGYDAGMDDVAADYLGLEDDATRPCLYQNLGGTFEDVAKEKGLDRPFLPMGANFGDFDNDGWLDMYLATGNPPFETLMPNVALRSDGARRFQDITRSAGLGHLQKGHGVTFGDIDNDGDQDIFHELGGFVPGDAFANALFANPGHGNHYLKVELRGTTANRAGVGARIRVVIETPAGERELHRAVGSVSSFGGAPRRQEIGLADATRIARLEIRWPGAVGEPQVFEDVPLDVLVRARQGAAALEIRPAQAFVLGAP